MIAYSDTVREHPVCYALKLGIVLLCCSLALQIVCQEVIQDSKCECSFNLFEGGWKEPNIDQLLIFLHSIGANTIQYLHVKDARLVDHSDLWIAQLCSAHMMGAFGGTFHQ